MPEAGVTSSPPADEEQYRAEKDHNGGELATDTSSQDDNVVTPKPVRPVSGWKVCLGCVCPRTDILEC